MTTTITPIVSLSRGYHPEHRELVYQWGKYPPRKTYLHLRDIDGIFDVLETNESQKISKYFIIVDRSKRRNAETMIHEITKALVSRIQDDTDLDAQLHLDQYLSLRTKLSLRGYTLEAVEPDKDIFNSATLPKLSSRQTYVDMSLNFGTKEVADMFPSLPAPAQPNPQKQTPTETQLVCATPSVAA